MTGAVTRGSTPAQAIFSGQSDGPKEMVVFIHLWCAAAFGTPGFAERTSRRRVFTSRRETSSQLPPYITYSFLRRSPSSESELSSWYMPFSSRAGDWYPSSFSPAAAQLSEAFSLPGRWRGGGEPSLEDCSRRPLTRFASFWISWQSAALWRAVGCTGHEPPLPPCGRGRLPCAFWSPAATAADAAAATGPPGCGSPRLRFLFFFFLPPLWAVAPEPPALASPSWGLSAMRGPQRP